MRPPNHPRPRPPPSPRPSRQPRQRRRGSRQRPWQWSQHRRGGRKGQKAYGFGLSIWSQRITPGTPADLAHIVIPAKAGISLGRLASGEGPAFVGMTKGPLSYPCWRAKAAAAPNRHGWAWVISLTGLAARKFAKRPLEGKGSGNPHR